MLTLILLNHSVIYNLKWSSRPNFIYCWLEKNISHTIWRHIHVLYAD